MMPLNCISIYYSPLFLFLLILLLHTKGVCSAVANPNFNENIRKYSIKEDNTNATNVSTLLKQGKEQYNHFVPIPNPITFKTVPDNELSSSSYSRGLHHADYGVHDYEETPNQGYGYEYHLHDLNNYGHAVNHHPVPIHTNYGDHHGDHYGGNYGNYHGNYGGHQIGHHYKHHDHDIAAKALLWPIAGIALLGAAAALVSNPVLLQLGVVSGRRKRRDTEEVTAPDDISIKNWSHEPNNKIDQHGNSYNVLPYVNKRIKKRISKLFKKEQTNSDTTTEQPFLNHIDIHNTKLNSVKKYLPIPLKVKPKIMEKKLIPV